MHTPTQQWPERDSRQENRRTEVCVFGGLRKMNKEDNERALRGQVHQRLKHLTEDNPVTIPKGKLAEQYAHTYASHMGLRYNIVEGKVALDTLRAQVFQVMALLTEDNTVRIPVGRQAASYAYAYAASVLRTCSVRKGIVTFVRKDNPQLRVRVFAALDAIAPGNPVKIPKGVLAAQYAYTHAREQGLHYKITSGGIVSILAGKELK